LIVPTELLERERQRLVIRQELVIRKVVVSSLVTGVAVFAISQSRNVIGDISGWLLVVVWLAFFVMTAGLVLCVDWAFYRIENRRLTRWDKAYQLPDLV